MRRIFLTLTSILLSLTFAAMSAGEGDLSVQNSAQHNPGANASKAATTTINSSTGTRMFAVLAIMALIALTWGIIIYRYHDKFPVLKNPATMWRGHARRS